jgi:hypothetical protein
VALGVGSRGGVPADLPDCTQYALFLTLLLPIAILPAFAAHRGRRWTVALRLVPLGAGLLGLVALLLGFGPNLSIPLGEEGVVPYAWLHGFVPGLSGVRTPARFAMFTVAALAAIAAAALAFLRRRTVRPVSRHALTAAAFALLLAEIWALPVALAEPGAGEDGVLRLLWRGTIERLPAPATTPRYPLRPRDGEILAVPVAPAPAARLFDATPGPWLRVLWTDEAGLPRTTEVSLRGTVLVDARRPALHALLRHMPEGGGAGRAALVSEERVARWGSGR